MLPSRLATIRRVTLPMIFDTDEMDAVATRETLDKLLLHEVVEDVPPGSVPERSTSHGGSATGAVIPLTAAGKGRCQLCAESTRGRNGPSDLYGLGSMPATNRLIDFLALKLDLEMFNLDCTEAYHHAPFDEAEYGRCSSGVHGEIGERRA